ncbi:MAG: EthD family reductase [Rubrivivax sp.]|nr:EthD family reductase [Rubrivivax sp.]
MDRVTPALKLSVLYGQPKDPAAFEAHYLGTHMPLVAAAPAPASAEATIGLPGPDGSAPPFYRLFEAWFDSAEHLAAVTGSPAWQRVVADVPNFASGGVTILLSQRA